MHIIWTLLILAGLAVAPAPKSSNVVIAQLSDIHYGSDRYEPAAWHQAWDEAAALRPHAVVFSGDQADNKCTPDVFVQHLKGVLGEMAPRIRKLGRPAVLALGNNDLVNNYQTDPETLGGAVRIYREVLGDLYYLDDLGNGTYPRLVAGMTWITINSVIFSPANKYAGHSEQAKTTLDFLEAELKKLPSGRPVVLVLHIPPTMDLYDGKLAWRPQYIERFNAIATAYSAPMMILGGHFHRNEVHAITSADGVAIPILLAGSLSFKYDNFPNWRTYAWTLGPQAHATAVAYRIRYPGHGEWSRRWQVDEPLRNGSWVAFIQRLADERTTWLDYMRDLYAHNAKWQAWSEAAGARLKMLDQILSRLPVAAP